MHEISNLPPPLDTQIKELEKEVQRWQELTDRWKKIAEDLAEQLEDYRAARLELKNALENVRWLEEK